jgi:hypothetical protein
MNFQFKISSFSRNMADEIAWDNNDKVRHAYLGE